MKDDLFHDTNRTHVADKPQIKTLYDWAPGKRWELLQPVGSTSIQMSVPANMPDTLGDVFGRLYRGGRLAGQALEDAKAR